MSFDVGSHSEILAYMGEDGLIEVLNDMNTLLLNGTPPLPDELAEKVKAHVFLRLTSFEQVERLYAVLHARDQSGTLPEKLRNDYHQPGWLLPETITLDAILTSYARATLNIPKIDSQPNKGLGL